MNKRNFNEFKLSDEILRALESLKYKNPTEVQEKVVPIVLENKDIVVKSQTGSGKTASFGIPLCENIIWEENNPQALVLTPTRELAVQVKEDISNIGRFKRIRAVSVFGKQPISQQQRELRQKTHVVVGTPGRVLDLIGKGSLILDNVKYLVIDEADEMLNMGFIEQVEDIIKEVPKNRVTMLFSATISEDVESLCNRYMKKPESVEIKAKGVTTDMIKHYLYEVREEEKMTYLRDILVVENPDSCIIFCRTKDNVDNVFNNFKKKQYPCEKIHGDMKQDERLAVMKNFKRGKFRFLIATDVAARGIDIEDVTHVINYDLPMEKESYVHRTGRTGRAGKSGKAITFVTPYEDRFLAQIEEYIGFKIEKLNKPLKEEVNINKDAFKDKMFGRPDIKKDKGSRFNKEIIKLYFNGGKKKKIRAVDFVGTISRIEGINPEDIGIIDIRENGSYVDILNGKGRMVLNVMKNTTIKGKLLKVEIAKN